jgi:hypothetical protein
MQEDRRFLRRKEAAEYVRTRWGVRCAAQTLAKLAVLGGGPPYRKAGRSPLYAPNDLDEWAESRLGPKQLSTSEFAVDQSK